MCDSISNLVNWIIVKTNACIVCIIFYVSSRLNDVNECIYYIYNSSDAMRNTCDIIHYQLRSAYACMFMNRIEPSQKVWICSSTIRTESVQDSPLYIYDSDYRFFDATTKEEACKIYNKQFASEIPLLNRIVIMKLQLSQLSSDLTQCSQSDSFTDTVYLCRKCETSRPPISEIEKSDVKFLAIEYTNPRMDHRLELFVGREWFLVDNEILTPTHILHILEHQSEPYVFDMNYKVHIIDSNIQPLELDASNYMKLEKKKYQITKGTA